MSETLRIGGAAVAPGDNTVIDLPITDLSTHTPITMPIQVIRGREDGPRVFVCAALHGDEINGVEIIRRVLREPGLAALRGTLVAVPIVNVLGFLSHSRYLPDRRDLNRTFPGSAQGSLAGRLAHIFLTEIVANCTHGIDLHTAARDRDNYPQIRANLDHAETDRLARAFGVPVINAGFREGSLRESAARHKVPVLVYEAGEALRFHEPSIAAGVDGIMRVLRTLKMLPPDKGPAPPEQLVARSSTWIRAPRSGIMRGAVALGEAVRESQELGIIADPFGGNEVAVLARTDGLVIGRTNLPLVHEGDALFHLVRDTGTQVVARSLDEPVETEDHQPTDFEAAAHALDYD
ncbi:MAG: succinylglutamate desuccinylase/aspartoacylase family protein [Alphaproteobacteria bacterium]|nr:succinylglutamate desuccinylase/aspartoacylase family protein [Alphaproteobacteria bacterium]